MFNIVLTVGTLLAKLLHVDSMFYFDLLLENTMTQGKVNSFMNK